MKIKLSVDDILIFDNAGTDGTGVSARVSKVNGEVVSSYTFENIEDTYYSVLTTSIFYNIIPRDQIFVDYTPVMDSTNKQFVVRQLKGIEDIVINPDEDIMILKFLLQLRLLVTLLLYRLDCKSS